MTLYHLACPLVSFVLKWHCCHNSYIPEHYPVYESQGMTGLPSLTPHYIVTYTEEKASSVYNGGVKWKGGTICENFALTIESRVRLIRHGVVR